MTATEEMHENAMQVGRGRLTPHHSSAIEATWLTHSPLAPSQTPCLAI
jgi:hypothetical protein